MIMTRSTISFYLHPLLSYLLFATNDEGESKPFRKLNTLFTLLILKKQPGQSKSKEMLFFIIIITVP
jgi:hypothetical protein